MFKNYIKIAFRNLFRKKLYSFLNITGLAIGLACSILLLFYIQDELSFDRFHEKGDRIYRVESDLSTSERTLLAATCANPMGPMLKADYPEIEEYVRFSSYGQQKIMQYGEKMFYEEKFLWVDSNIFEVFSFTFLKGDPEDALVRPNTMVITRDMAVKYFGDEDPIGKSLRFNNESLYEVTGVLENIPKTSHVRPDFLASIATLNLKPSGNAVQDLLTEINYYTFLLLREGTDPAALEQKFTGFLDKTIGPAMKSMKGSAKLTLRPVAEIYLYSDRENDPERTSSVTFIYLFAGIGLFILLLACLNFMNLSTARSANRAREVGLRKVVGAHKRQLIQQFLGESAVITFIAAAISLVLVFLSMPLFRTLSGKDLRAQFLIDPVFLLGLLALVLLISLIGGSYPAFFLSAFRPIETLQGKLKRGSTKSFMRIALVSFQFTVSIVLIIGTLTVSKQLTHIRNKDLGYDKDHIVSILVRNPETQKKMETVKSIFLQNPDVLATAASATTPLGWSDFRGDHPVGKSENEMFMMFVQFVDEDYVGLYDMNILEGRNFSREFPNDPQNSIIINQTAARKFGWEEDPLTHELEVGHEAFRKKMRFKVIGVVEDFHFQSLHEEVNPMILYNSCLYGSFNQISVKMRPENVQSTITFLRSQWEKIDSQYPFEFTFVDDQFDELYRAEERMGSLFGYFTALAIAIGCLGLFGLTSFTAEQRTKEIGIRKILGASVSGIIFLLIREFTKWVLVAALIAWPIGYLVMNSWLKNFAYRINMGFDTLALAALLALMVSLITVSFQSIRAALAEPIDSLRYE